MIDHAIKSIPSRNTSPDGWIQFHKDLKSRYGAKVANRYWILFWEQRGSNAVNTANLREYLRTQNLEIESSAWNKVVDKGIGALDFAGSIFKTGTYVGLAWMGFIAIAGGVLIWNIVRNPIEAGKTAASLRTGGLK